jgi:hypothetical protein
VNTADERLHRKRFDRIARGREAYASINSGEHFSDWLAVADGLVAIREEAMDIAHTNRPQGPSYRAAFKRAEEREVWATGINDSARAHCYWLIDNLPAVQRWRETLANNQRNEWNHPSTVKRNFERMTKVPVTKDGTAPLSPMAQAKATIVRQAEEIDRLKRLADGGSLFDLKRDSAPTIARIILNTIGDDKVARLIKGLSDGRKEKQRRREAHAG